MFKINDTENKSVIGKNAHDNIVVQDSNIINNYNIVSSPAETIDFLGQYDAYKGIQDIVKSVMSSAYNKHPLFPEFSATYDPKLKQLVSTPETEDAFKKHPKRIQGTFTIDLKRYPGMDKEETPWEYAYRTQSKVVLGTKNYKEYLGDTEDPFPVIENASEMIIGYNEFPEAVSATVEAGDISVPIMLRRKPHQTFGELLFANTSFGHGFNIEIIVNEKNRYTTFNLTKIDDCGLKEILVREELINAIHKSKSINISINASKVISAPLKDEELATPFFEHSNIIKTYVENLLIIEKHLGCKFDNKLGEFSFDDVETAILIASSLEGKWRLRKKTFDDSVRCDYDHIPDNIENYNARNTEAAAEMKVLSIKLHGQEFLAEKYTVVYKDARINNIGSVIKNRKLKRNNILFTFKPVNGKEKFEKYEKLEGLSVVNKESIGK